MLGYPLNVTIGELAKIEIHWILIHFCCGCRISVVEDGFGFVCGLRDFLSSVSVQDRSTFDCFILGRVIAGSTDRLGS